MTNQACLRIDWSNLKQVKELVIDLSNNGKYYTVVLRPGDVVYRIIQTQHEKEQLRGAQVVFRTGEDL